jgi:predicted PurR-regulated permease PerM
VANGSSREFAKRVAVATIVVLIVVAAAYAVSLLLLVFAGILLAILLRTVGEWVSRTGRIPVRVSMAAVVVAFVGVLLGMALGFGATMAAQADQLFIAVSQAVSQAFDQIQQYKGLQQILTKSSGFNLVEPAQTAASVVFWIGSALVLILFVGVYVALYPDLYIDTFLSLFGRTTRTRVTQLLEEIGGALQWWLLGQLVAMAVVGGITAIGLVLLGIPMALPLAVLAALLTFVPYIGALISSAPALVIALTLSNRTALYVLFVYAIAHFAEGYIIVPMIQHRFVRLPPALILAAQFLAQRFLGITGVALVTPVLVVAMVLVNRLYFHQDWESPKAA